MRDKYPSKGVINEKKKEIYLRDILQKNVQHSVTNLYRDKGEGIVQNDFKISRFHRQLYNKNACFSL